LRYHQELTSLDEQALHRIARAAGRSLLVPGSAMQGRRKQIDENCSQPEDS
jgi:hypothetical protein